MDDLYIENFFRRGSETPQKASLQEITDTLIEPEPEATDPLSQMYFYFRPLKNDLKNKLKEEQHIQGILQKIEEALPLQNPQYLYSLLEQLEEFLVILNKSS